MPRDFEAPGAEFPRLQLKCDWRIADRQPTPLSPYWNSREEKQTYQPYDERQANAIHQELYKPARFAVGLAKAFQISDTCAIAWLLALCEPESVAVEALPSTHANDGGPNLPRPAIGRT